MGPGGPVPNKPLTNLGNSAGADCVISLRNERFCKHGHAHSLHTMAIFQGRTKGQQLKGKIVSHFFALFGTFSEFFPQDFPLKNKGF